MAQNCRSANPTYTVPADAMIGEAKIPPPVRTVHGDPPVFDGRNGERPSWTLSRWNFGQGLPADDGTS